MSLDNFTPSAASGSRSENKPPLIVIVGPTAVGKTEISIQLARHLDGEIVSADSRLFYRGMDIGTAKPSREQRNLVPHHLIDIADPHETWNLALFQQAARQAIGEIRARGRLPFLVGGTGQYIHAVTHGWVPPIVTPDPQLRSELEALAELHGAQWLHDMLRGLDPSAAEKIDPRNLRRTIRALEVIRLTGEKFSAQRGRAANAYRLLTIGLTLSRPELYARLDARIDAMFASGLLEEVKCLLDAGVSPDLPAMTSIGYRECVSVLQGRATVEEAKVQMRRLTRGFVRRQANWFKINDPAIHWFDADPDPLPALETTIREFLLQENDHELA
jgi:tRNA dimethylallyltransferase